MFEKGRVLIYFQKYSCNFESISVCIVIYKMNLLKIEMIFCMEMAAGWKFEFSMLLFMIMRM